jgi:HAD superfamily hydrolase (TIGR01549 family)
MNPAPSLVTTAAAVLLDFDGPVCSIFAGYPAPEVAEELRHVMHQLDVPTDGQISTEPDPIAILAYVGQNARYAMRAVEEAMCSMELEAAKSAAPSAGSDEFIRYVAALHKPLIVVSNNSAPAIESYLRERDLDRFVQAVIGRSFGRPERMKPNPWPIKRAIDLAQQPAHRCVIIGDSVTDVAAAHAAGALCIGVADKPYKVQALPDAGADAMVMTMTELTSG